MNLILEVNELSKMKEKLEKMEKMDDKEESLSLLNKKEFSKQTTMNDNKYDRYKNQIKKIKNTVVNKRYFKSQEEFLKKINSQHEIINLIKNNKNNNNYNENKSNVNENESNVNENKSNINENKSNVNENKNLKENKNSNDKNFELKVLKFIIY
jgi:hypothetical protein